MVNLRFCLGFCLMILLAACSTTSSESRAYLAEVDSQQISSKKMHVSVEGIVRSLQKSGGLYTLHLRPDGLKQIFESVSRAYGFESVSLDEAIYDVRLKAVFPDGGECEDIGSSSLSGLSYSVSVLTLGIVPATFTHCFVVKLELWELIDYEWLMVGEFESNTGRVDVYGGLNDVDDYSVTVTVRDESRAIETSMSSLLGSMIKDGAFE